MSVIDYAASGNTSVSGISIATGMAPSSVDNAMRKIIDDIGEGLANGYFATALPATKSAGYTVLTTDRGKLFNCTSALTLALPAAATAAAGFMFWVKANGAAVILDPNAAELIDGAATVTIASGSSAFVVCTGTAWVTAFVATSYDWAAAVVAASAKATPIDADSIGLVDSAAANVLKKTTIGELKAVVLASAALTGTPTAPTQTASDNSTKIATTAYVDATGGKTSKRIYTSSDTWSKPTGLVKVVVTVMGGGGGGGGLGSASTGSWYTGSGGGGGVSIKTILAASLGATETVTVGAAGTAGASTPANGGAGGTSSFGAHCQATGGAGGPLANTGTPLPVASGAGGVGSSGDINLTGGKGSHYNSGSSLDDQMIFGGNNALGGQGPMDTLNGSSFAVENADANSGCGGTGVMRVGTNTARAGGAGGAGLVIVEEYFA